MKTRYIPAGVMLTAGIVTCVVSIVQKQEVIRSLVTLLTVLILFYIIGLIAKFFIDRILKDLKKTENNDAVEADDIAEEAEDSENISSDVENSSDSHGKNRL
ncbi:hypothetical protein [[Clostridium] polysaccharolyticum]|uniref:Uncharacterized protein n=1 Tax=[Clostridium] polysaccharolyticum TaxID=29364 RepID=A0A1H9Y339_9FIRM|nr:hypothetical protein [[Clostridium] polysaccharolyticum]SES63221.1 hypothetical protein SAMN04487772_101105 [[Clostridium] polysaccharolyticum]